MVTCIYSGSLVKQNGGVCVCARARAHITRTYIGREGDGEAVGEGRERQTERGLF